MASIRRSIFLALCLGTVLNCSGQGHSLWLSKRSAYGAGRHGRTRCQPQVGHCPCGEDGRTTVIRVKQCPFSTDWGTLCEPCVKEEELCARLENCTRCNDHNPAAICAECPRDRFGMHCENELQCELPELSMYTKSKTVITQSRPKSRRKSLRRPKRQVYRLEFSCADGMLLIGPKSIKCKKSREWNNFPPKCVFPTECPSQAPPISGARVKEQTKQYVRYECDVGYVSASNVTETRVQCENGAWLSTGESGMLLKCEPLPPCNDLPHYTGARLTTESATTVKASYLQGEQLHYECGPEYRPVNPASGKTSLTCEGGTWHGEPPVCELRGCKKFTVDGGNVSYSLPDTGDERYVARNTVAHVQCHQGYDLVPYDAGSTTCTSAAIWEPAAPKCRRECERTTDRYCPVSPPTYAVADPAANKTRPGEIVRFHCKEGFYRKLSTPSERICLINGTLTGTDIECLRVPVCNISTLSIPPVMTYCCMDQAIGKCSPCTAHGTYDFPDGVVHVGVTLEFSCRNDQAYELTGSEKKLMCSPTKRGTGEFRPHMPHCKVKCGRRPFPAVPLVMGGKPSDITRWPWQAGIFQVAGTQGQFLCGAVLIAERWLLTAAHCLTVSENSTEFLTPRDLKVIYGKSSVDGVLSNAHSISQIIPYHGFNKKLLHDIALLKLEEPITANETVGVVCLPCPAEQPLAAGDEGVVTGWGSDLSELREVQLSVAEDKECKKHFTDLGYDDGLVTSDTFCSVSNTTTDDASDGDSGGPFVVQAEDGRWVLQGIVSWGAPPSHGVPPNSSRSKRRASDRHARRASRGQYQRNSQNVNHDLTKCRGEACYGGYVKVANYVDWIVEQTGMIVCA